MTTSTMTPTLTPRVLSLAEDAAQTLRQAIYEGWHVRRQEPSPREGSPWDTPDAPIEFVDALRRALDEIDRAVRASA